MRGSRRFFESLIPISSFHTLLTFSFLLALNFLSCSTVSGRWIL